MADLPATVKTALADAAALLERITFDSDGVMVGMVRQGGNGGIISNETLKAADQLRRSLDDLAVLSSIEPVQEQETENQRLRKALDTAAEEFALIELRLRDKQPARALGAAMCGQKDARAMLKAKG